MSAPRLVWMPPDFDVAYVSKSDYDELQAKLKSTERELAKWKEPFDQEKFDAAAKQASHKDSLAAMCVYQTALEHALKHHQAKLTETERLNKVALEAMKELEWCETEYDPAHGHSSSCPSCGGASKEGDLRHPNQEYGHYDDCPIANAIKEIEGALK